MLWQADYADNTPTGRLYPHLAALKRIPEYQTMFASPPNPMDWIKIARFFTGAFVGAGNTLPCRY